ncbi:MAG: DUF3380 domain-containing protein [Nitrospinaceae bacterium]|nr:DUF3380 domain-containing protein [Nitrospinaceae bacterium]NIR56496.1 DUF3380 domain-containing protein [Nitrospinaceae bacterium]NIS86954.1 DUF3380 domain-containing protein [Nitrospinaceae bacterium]NIT83798.1 DUF3380 domain-containing protein [Nitrospinaceae bacterium]NIU46004.1 DUF3380 domain-containing protein [Nitrospinaceae bacterium]
MSQTGIVTASALNFRPEPSTQRPPLGQLKRGTQVKVLGRQGRWYRIQSNGQTGFVYGDFLEIHEDQPFARFLYEQADLQTHPLKPDPDESLEAGGDGSPGEKQVAKTWNQFGGLIQKLSEVVDVEPASALAVLVVESSGRGFSSDGRMIIRFENHKFLKYYGKNHPDKFKAHFKFDPEKRWLGHRFRKSPNGRWQTFHGKQNEEWKVFDFARELHAAAAMRSISMGLPQIMGFNHAVIGYDSVGEMFDHFSDDVRFHILGLFDFIRGASGTSPMLQALQRQDFEKFASRYNGPGQAAKYGAWIESRYDTFHQLRG